MNYATCSFYEDLRQEINGKVMRIGEYFSDMQVEKFPIEFNQFWITIKYGTPALEPDNPASVNIEIPGQDAPIEIKLTGNPVQTGPEPSDDVSFFVSKIDLPIRPLVISSKGIIKVSVITQSGAIVPAGRLLIKDTQEGNAFNLPMHILIPGLAHFNHLTKNEPKKNVDAFASKIFRLLAGSIDNQNTENLLAQIGDKIVMDETSVLVVFDPPRNRKPNVDINLPEDSPEAKIQNLDRLGFELKYETPPSDPIDFQYSIHEIVD
jgi:hypothetical protein